MNALIIYFICICVFAIITVCQKRYKSREVAQKEKDDFQEQLKTERFVCRMNTKYRHILVH